LPARFALYIAKSALRTRPSAECVDVLPTSTLFGLAFYDPGAGDVVLLNREYPQDFFVFIRTPTETGMFLSTAGLVESDDEVETVRPTATLVVTQVPEPATLLILGGSLAGLAWFRKRV